MAKELGQMVGCSFCFEYFYFLPPFQLEEDPKAPNHLPAIYGEWQTLTY